MKLDKLVDVVKDLDDVVDTKKIVKDVKSDKKVSKDTLKDVATDIKSNLSASEAKELAGKAKDIFKK